MSQEEDKGECIMSKAKDEVRVLLFVPVMQKTMELSFSTCLKVKEAKDLCRELLANELSEKMVIDEETLVCTMDGRCLDPEKTVEAVNLRDWDRICFF